MALREPGLARRKARSLPSRWATSIPHMDTSFLAVGSSHGGEGKAAQNLVNMSQSRHIYNKTPAGNRPLARMKNEAFSSSGV